MRQPMTTDGLSYAAVAAAAAAAPQSRGPSTDPSARDSRSGGVFPPPTPPPPPLRASSRRQQPSHRTSSTVRSREAPGATAPRFRGGTAAAPPSACSWSAEATTEGRGRPPVQRGRTETYASFFKTSNSVRKPPSPAVTHARGAVQPPPQPTRFASCRPSPKEVPSLTRRNKAPPPPPAPVSLRHQQPPPAPSAVLTPKPRVTRTASENPVAKSVAAANSQPIFSSRQSHAVFPPLASASLKPSRVGSARTAWAVIDEAEDGTLSGEARETPEGQEERAGEASEAEALSALNTRPEDASATQSSGSGGGVSTEDKPGKASSSPEDEEPHSDYVTLMIFWYEVFLHIGDEEKRIAAAEAKRVADLKGGEVSDAALQATQPSRVAVANCLKFLAEVMQAEAEICRLKFEDSLGLENDADNPPCPIKIKDARQSYMAAMCAAEAAMEAYRPSAFANQHPKQQ